MYPLFDSGCGTSGGSYWTCCTVEKPCGANEGDCDFNNQCKEGLICGVANCIGPEHPLNADCCEPGTTTPAPTPSRKEGLGPQYKKLGQFERYGWVHLEPVVSIIWKLFDCKLWFVIS